MMNIGMLNKKADNIGVFTIIGVAAFTGLALVVASPRMRKNCTDLLSGVFNRVKNKISNLRHEESRDWEKDLTSAEKLKGDINKRKTPVIKAPSVASTAWKEE
ncbi:hypothetical protein [Pedobacter sp. SL55]|uniref:hypothetical protein n=1 Tax=Pedobacter sp. SL55 TaxID=2995161 RepID=UPI00226DFD5A|nr:hypothetical protein [Pedobacter sp. SL55]WAC39703.1 hypothetical protein OVA16_14090 [Pedobacter sp. SL55]